MVNTKHNNFSFLKDIIDTRFIEIDGNDILFKIQDGPIKECGENGCQIDELGKVWLSILQHFNSKFPCRENSIAITKIEEALMWQEKRKENREKRGVEGTNAA